MVVRTGCSHKAVFTSLIASLENWQRVLKWPKHFSNTAAVSLLEVDSRLVVRKLGFLKRQLGEDTEGV